MYLSTQPYKGTRDFYPKDMQFQKWMFQRMSRVVERFGYQQYDGPLLEPFELYAAKTGEEIVNQQLYSLMDRGERKLAIRPEMTPTLARMVAAKVHELPKPIRWYSLPNLWRYERPQRGRLREHWQLNVDVIGGDRLLADAEILSVALQLIQDFGGQEHVIVRLNHRELIDRFFSGELGLSPEDSLKTMKAVDARAKIGEESYQKWLKELGLDGDKIKKMESFFHSDLDTISRNFSSPAVEHLRDLMQVLSERGFGRQVVFDPMVLRGLDYYTGTVFEMYDSSPENRRAMFGGGRYDNLIGLFGSTQLSGVGFGMGDVTLKNFLEVHNLVPQLPGSADVLITLPRVEHRRLVDQVATELQENGLRVITPLTIEGFGAHLKAAARHSVPFVILLGDDELKEKSVGLKNLLSGVQEKVLLKDLAQRLKDQLKDLSQLKKATR